MQDFYNPMGGYQQPFYTGMVNPQPQVANDPKTFCQTLTVDQMNMLKKHVEEFTLAISEKDKLASICMHREPGTGKSMLVSSGAENDGSTTCLICGKTFHIIDNLKDDDVIRAVNNLIDVIQTTKTMYLDMPVESAKNFYPILALIEKIPGLYKIASDNFSKHEKAANGILQQSSTNMMGMYNMLASPWTGTNMYNPYGGQPMYNQPYAQPMGAQPMMGYAPMGAPVQQPMAGGANPFFASQPQPMQMQQPMGYQPQQTAYAYTPNTMTQAVTVPTTDQAAAPQVAPPQATTDGQTVNVSQSFQA